MVDVGDTAPDFTLNDQAGQPVTLAQYGGERGLLLVFFPLAFSGVCTSELCALRDRQSELEDLGVKLLAVSVDSPFSLGAWARQEEYRFPLLSDFWPHGATAQAYGVFDPQRGVATRGTFAIDTEGVVRWKVVNPVPQARSVDDYLKGLSELG